MANSITTPLVWDTPSWTPLPKDIPILYEDEEEGDMGEVNYHVLTDEILHVCLGAHFAEHLPECQVFSNMNLYYLDAPPHPVTGSPPYVSPDAMVVQPYQRLPQCVASYTIGRDGPPPLATAEVLSDRSAQQRDLTEKLIVYQMLKVPEYFLVDQTAEHLPERLLLKRLGADGKYHDHRNADGGVTSTLGFRLVIEADGLRVTHAATGYRYIRPMEAEKTAKAWRLAEEARREAEASLVADRTDIQVRLKIEAELAAAQTRLNALEAELARLKKKD
jgi:Uma2 family endonuclease